MASDSNLTILAHRAVATPRWRWVPGMLAVEWAVPGMVLTDGRPVRVDDRWHEVGVWLPDLSDPATLGCLLALVREAWGDPTLSPCWQDETGGWDVVGNRWNIIAGSTTEAEALVVALGAACTST